MDELDRFRNFGSLLCIIGVGTSGIVEKVAADKILSAKDVLVLALPGEERPKMALPPTFRVQQALNVRGLQDWVFLNFSEHEQISRLAGADFLDDHPLCAEAQAFRDQHRERLYAMIADKPWALGNDVMDTYAGMYHAAFNNAILETPSLGQLAGSAGQVPCISIGAGPSVGEHLDELRALQDRCILVACDAVYEGLINEGIVPHFVCPQERLQQQAPLVKKARGTRTIFAGIAACHMDTVNHFEGRTIYLHAMDKLYDWLAPEEKLRCMTGSSTGVLSFVVASSLGRGKVYLVGHDLAMEGESHWKGADFSGGAFQQEQSKAGGYGSNGYEERWIPGNSGELVKSIMWWDTFRSEISMQASLMPGRVCNVNGATKKYALIEHTLAEGLPDPGQHEILPPLALVSDNHQRRKSFTERVRELPADADRFLASMSALRTSLRAMQRTPAHSWDLGGLLEQLTPHAGVSPGNSAAFQYFLRSVMTNEQAYASWRARGHQSKEECFFFTMRNMDAIADAMENAVKQLKPSFEELACL